MKNKDWCFVEAVIMRDLNRKVRFFRKEDREDISQQTLLMAVERYQAGEYRTLSAVCKYCRGQVSNLLKRNKKDSVTKPILLGEYFLKLLDEKHPHNDLPCEQLYFLDEGISNLSSRDRVIISALLNGESPHSLIVSGTFKSKRDYYHWRKYFLNRSDIFPLIIMIKKREKSKARGAKQVGSGRFVRERFHPRRISPSTNSGKPFKEHSPDTYFLLTPINGEKQPAVGPENGRKKQKLSIYGICKVLPDLEAVQGLLLTQQIESRLSGSGLYVADIDNGCCESTWKQKLYIQNGMYRWRCYKCQDVHQRWPNTLEGFLMSIFGTLEDVKKVIGDFSRH